MKRKRVLPPTYLLISIITMALLHYLTPISELIAYPLTLFGIVPLAAGIALNLMADSVRLWTPANSIDTDGVQG